MRRIDLQNVSLMNDRQLARKTDRLIPIDHFRGV